MKSKTFFLKVAVFIPFFIFAQDSFDYQTCLEITRDALDFLSCVQALQ